jgi:hypothetical protein
MYGHVDRFTPSPNKLRIVLDNISSNVQVNSSMHCIHHTLGYGNLGFQRQYLIVQFHRRTSVDLFKYMSCPHHGVSIMLINDGTSILHSIDGFRRLGLAATGFACTVLANLSINPLHEMRHLRIAL